MASLFAPRPVLEIVAAGRQTAAPFALCPGHHLLAVGMAAQGRGDAERGASRVDVLRLLLCSGEDNLGEPLHVACDLETPGLCRVAWSAAPTDQEPGFTLVGEELHYAGLLAGGFNDGAVRIWNPASDLAWDLSEGVPEKPKAVWRLCDDPETGLTEETIIPVTISDMYAKIRKMKWASNNDELKAWFDGTLFEDSELYPCPKVHYGAKMEPPLTECKILKGPVLGLSFNDLHPYWIGTAALGESIYVHDISYPVELCRLTCELKNFGSAKENTQMTCLKWNKIYPTSLAATSNKGTTKVWDLRTAKLMTTFDNGEGTILSDLEFSWNNPMHLAVSTVNSGTSAAVTVWDMRHSGKPYHEYSTGTSGVTSLSWNRSGQLLASHTDGTISCCDVYNKEMVQGLTSASHGDLGVTWTHSENTFATLSSKYGVRLHVIE